MSDTKINDGGPAFPIIRMPIDPDTILNHPGMSLRDWFAGQALAGWLASFDADMVHPVRNNTEYSTAMACYKMADSMIAARNAK